MTTLDHIRRRILPGAIPVSAGLNEPFACDREHVLQGEDVELSLHDRNGDPAQWVAAFVNQGTAGGGPTIGVWSETVGTTTEPAFGFELKMTRAEAVRLWAELGRMIDATG